MTQAPQSTSRKGYLLLGLAVVTCPCHLPILLALLTGAAVAGIVGQHFGLVFGALTVIFAVSLLLGLRALRPAHPHVRDESTPERDANPVADLSGAHTGRRAAPLARVDRPRESR